MDITPINPDYLKSSLDDIAICEINRHQENLDGLKSNGKLCCDDGRFIVAEMGFKGNTEQVIEQMEQHIQNLKDNGLKDTDRVPMQEAYMYACTMFAMEQEDINNKETFNKALIEGDATKMMQIIEQTTNMKQSMHDRKECLCYINN